MNGDILIGITFFISLFGVAYIFLTTRHKERLALIEKGADASLFNPGKKRNSGMGALKFGMLSVGIAVGILLGSIIDKTTLLPEEIAYLSMIFLCGGSSLILFYFIERKLEKDKF
jgi:hypothetical protein